MAKVADPEVIKFLNAIRHSRSSMRDTSERIYQRYVTLLAQNAASPEAVDKAGLEFEDAKIKLAQAEIDLLNAQCGNVPAAAAFAPSLASVVAQAATEQRHLVYVHGICKHVAGYSDPMWLALHDYETTAFGLGILGQTRLEVLWSDVITPDTPQAAMALAPALAIQSSERQRVADEIREELRQRAARHAVTAAAHMPAAAAIEPTTAAGLLSIPTIGCIDDFAYYLLNDSIRAGDRTLHRLPASLTARPGRHRHHQSQLGHGRGLRRFARAGSKRIRAASRTQLVHCRRSTLHRGRQAGIASRKPGWQPPGECSAVGQSERDRRCDRRPASGESLRSRFRVP